jgi:hypothetical protein
MPPNATKMNYRYNGAGERVYRSGSGETVHTVFDPSGRWIGDYDANGVAIQQAPDFVIPATLTSDRPFKLETLLKRRRLVI